MADLSQTAADVKTQGLTVKTRNVTGGETIAVGAGVALRAGKWYNAEADDATYPAELAGQGGVAVAMTACAADGDAFLIATEGPIDLLPRFTGANNLS